MKSSTESDWDVIPEEKDTIDIKGGSKGKIGVRWSKFLVLHKECGHSCAYAVSERNRA